MAVSAYLDRAEAAGLSWPLPEGLGAGELERRLFKPGGRPAERGLVEPDFDVLHRELRRQGMTLFLLWQAYRERHPEGYSYSQFCARYSVWKGRVDVVMRQTHRAGWPLSPEYATLSNAETYGGLFEGAPSRFDGIITNPPFGGKEGQEARNNLSFKTSATQVLFLQHILTRLKPALDGRPGGRCGVVLDEGLLFRTNESAFVETKRKLLDECDLWCIVSLPGGVFSTAGAGVKTNLLFFTKGRPTERIWYYDLSHVKVGKKSPLTLAHFGWGPRFEILEDADLPATLVGDWREARAGEPFPSFARLLQGRGTAAAESDFSWTLDFVARRAQALAEMSPLLAEVAHLRAQALALKERISQGKKTGAKETELATDREQLLELEKQARETQAAADAIDAASFDLKAVNPCAARPSGARYPFSRRDPGGHRRQGVRGGCRARAAQGSAGHSFRASDRGKISLTSSSDKHHVRYQRCLAGADPTGRGQSLGA